MLFYKRETIFASGTAMSITVLEPIDQFQNLTPLTKMLKMFTIDTDETHIIRQM